MAVKQLGKRASNPTDAATLADLAGRNRIINGGFRVNQRAYASGASLAANAYGHDRWKGGANGATYTFGAANPAAIATITAGSLVQVVDVSNVEGGTYTLSWAGTAQGRVTRTSGGNSATTAYGASPLTITGVDAGTAVTIEFGTGTLGLVQFESGAVATAFERRPASYEILLCQFYYQAGQLRNYSTNNYTGGVFPLPVTMRAQPTLAYYDFGGTRDANNLPTPGNKGLISTSNNFSPGLAPQYGGVNAYANRIDTDIVFNTSSCGNWAGYFYTLDAEIY